MEAARFPAGNFVLVMLFVSAAFLGQERLTSLILDNVSSTILQNRY